MKLWFLILTGLASVMYADDVRTVELPTGDIIYDPVSQMIYASVPGNGGTLANSITAIDPVTGILGPSIPRRHRPRKARAVGRWQVPVRRAQRDLARPTRRAAGRRGGVGDCARQRFLRRAATGRRSGGAAGAPGSDRGGATVPVHESARGRRGGLLERYLHRRPERDVSADQCSAIRRPAGPALRAG